MTSDPSCCGPSEEQSDHPPSTDRTEIVRDRYGAIASAETDCCDEPSDVADPDERGREIGYADDDLTAAPEGANLGLGCGNPVALAALEPGETVLDLGSGSGFDCFLAAREVGPEGQVIGVDMTPEMLDRARENARESDLETVEFRLGEIEHLPVADESIDVIISNCVINLSEAKRQVLAEAYRVLKPGGRLSIADLVATEPLPEAVRADPDPVAGCVGDAARIEQFERWLTEIGFDAIDITVEGEWDATYEGESLPIVSARIEAVVPDGD